MQNSQENTCAGVFYLNKFAGLQPAIYLTETPAQVLSCKFCETFSNTFLTKHLRPSLPTPKFRSTPLTPFFWPTPTTHKISTHATTSPTPKNFMDPRYPRYPRQNLTHATHAPTLPTPPMRFSRLLTMKSAI